MPRRHYRLVTVSSRAAVVTAAVGASLVTAVVSPARASALPSGLYVERIGGTAAFGAGAGPANTTTALPVFVDAFGLGTPTAPTLTLSLPTTDNATTKNWALTHIGNGDTGTEFTLDTMQMSPNGRYLTLVGYDDAAGTTVRTSGGVKTIGVIDVTTGTVSTSVKFAGSSTPRSVVTVDATRFWYMGSSQGERYVVPASDPANNSNTTQLSASGSLAQRTQSIFGGQLFLSGKSMVSGTTGTGPGIASIGVGIPNSSQTGLNQNYFITTGTNPAQFVMLDQNAAVGYTAAGGTATGLDVCYVGTDNGVEKYTFDGTSWTQAYSTALGLSTTNTSKLFGGISGLTFAGKDANGNNILFGTTNGNNGKSAVGQGNALVRLVDTGASSTWELVASSPDNSWFRGLQYVKPSLVGDTNDDGVVDLTDLNNVLNNFGASGTNPGDDNGDSVVDLTDLNNVLNNFGATGAASALASVPEPASLSLLAIGATTLLARRRRSR